MPYRKLVLFDIDGTLMNSDGAGNQAFVDALTQIFDRRFSADSFSASGKTDTQIALELCEKFGVSRDEAMTRLPDIRERYLAGFEKELIAAKPTVFAGVRELVAAVADIPTCLMGLLTGNFEPAGWMKVESVGLREPFQMGAFGDNAPQRSDLPGRAVERAKELTGQTFEGKEIVIIGDTPNDVACGRHLDVTAIAVATGRYDESALMEAEPDFLFADFSEPSRVVDAITR